MRDFRLVLLTCILTACSLCHDGFGKGSSEPAPDPGKAERADLLPQNVRWQTFSADVRDVKIDRRGRPWFHINYKGTINIAQVKHQVERAAKLKAPWFLGGRIVLFDSAGRVWLLPDADRRLLLGYDPKSGMWIRRRAAAANDWSGYAGRPQVIFTTPAHQSKSGCLYFTDRLGVHVFARGRWNYQHLYKLNIKHNLYYDKIKSFNEPRFAEDDAGRVYVWSGWGCYGWTGTVGFFVHDGKTWTHHLIKDWRRDIGPDGKDAEPQRTDSVNKPDLNRLGPVVPLTGSRALVCAQTGPAFIVNTTTNKVDAAIKRRIQKDISLLGDNSWKVRTAAHERLERLGPFALPLLKQALKQYKDLEIVLRLKHIIRACEPTAQSPKVDGYVLRVVGAWCIDAERNTWLLADHCRTPDGHKGRNVLLKISPQGKISTLPKCLNDWCMSPALVGRDGRVYIARYEKGCAVFDGETISRITDDTEIRYSRILGQDADGRVFFTDGRVAAFRLGCPDVRPTLPMTIYEVPRSENIVCLDSTGRLWAVVFDAETHKPKMAWFGPNGWNPVDLPGGINTEHTGLRLFQPLKRGYLVVQEVWSNRAFLFNGDEWETHANLRELVEKRHSLLVKLLDNRRWGRDFYAKLRVDDEGRIWVIEWTKAAAYDGKCWTDLRGPLVKVNSRADMFNFCIPLDRGRKMLVDNNGVFVIWIDRGRVRVGRPELPLPRREIRNDYTTRTGMWYDRQGRLYLPRDAGSCIRVDQKPQVIKNTGFPRFADSGGRVWFLNPQQGKLVVLDPKGRRAVLKNEWLHSSSAVAENAPGSVWVGTRLGLLHLHARRTDDGIAIQPVKHYEKNVPKGECLKMFVDKYRNLWFYGPGPQNYRLYRVQLPKNSHKP